MNISQQTIAAIGKVVTGDAGISPYQSGPKLVDFFNQFGANDKYGDGFPSRWKYAEDEIAKLNRKPLLEALILRILDPRCYFDTEFDVNVVCKYINMRLNYDGYEVVIDGLHPKILGLGVADTTLKYDFSQSREEGHIFIREQIKKAESKIQNGDYDGAITNARSLVEAVLLDIEGVGESGHQKYDGDIIKLYKRVQGKLNLNPGRADIEGSLKQVLSGLNSIIAGLAGISNRMGDRHARSYRPAERHAILAVNAARTMVNFLYDTKIYQKIGEG